MKTAKKDFDFFIKEIKFWIEKFKLDDYEVTYYWRDLKDENLVAISEIDGDIGSVGIVLNSSIIVGEKETLRDIISVAAKHEVAHCLIGRLCALAHKRYSTKDELVDEEEHLVRKLTKLL